MFLFGVLGFFGVLSHEEIQIRPGYENSINPKQVLPLFILTGTFIGIVFPIMEIFFDEYSSKRIPIGLDLMLKA